MIEIKQQMQLIKDISVDVMNQKSIKIILNREWLKQFEKKASVYCLFNNDKIVYVGETKNLRKRMNNLFYTTQHILRRKIGEREFFSVSGYTKPTSKKKYNDEIEKKVGDYIEQKLNLKYFYTTIGRKEVEEYMISQFDYLFNK